MYIKHFGSTGRQLIVQVVHTVLVRGEGCDTPTPAFASPFFLVRFFYVTSPWVASVLPHAAWLEALVQTMLAVEEESMWARYESTANLRGPLPSFFYTGICSCYGIRHEISIDAFATGLRLVSLYFAL